jgi:large subunit ribosomal protein L23
MGRTDKAQIPAHLLAKLEELFGGESKEELFEQTFGKKIVAVNTMMTTKGTKKAIITFEEKNAAEEILSQLGIV